MNRTTIILAMALALGAASQARANEVYTHIGTEGIGLGFSQSISPTLGVRVEGNYGRISRSFETDGVKYDAKIKLGGVGVIGDWFVNQGGFRLSGGLTWNDKKGNGSGHSSTDSVVINGQRYSLVGEELRGAVKFPTFMPYLGIGWGHHNAGPGWNFTADLGVMFGKPKASLTATPGLAAQAGSNIEAERRELQDEADKYRVFPILKIGASYRF